MAKSEDVLDSTSLLSILPVLSLDCKKFLVQDLERVVKAMGNKQNHHALREVYKAVKLDLERETK